MYTRKFYDMDATETSAASNETAGSSSQPESIAAIMAREGVKSGMNDEPSQPIRISSNQSSDDTSSNSSSAAPAKSEESVESNEDYDNSSASKGNESYDLSSIIEKESPVNILKALGYDDKSIAFMQELKSLDPKMIGFLETWKNGGDVKQYLDEASRDFLSMPAEEVMKHQLRLDYPKATESQIDVLYKKEVVEKYNLNSYDEDEVKEGKLLLEAKADKYREQLQDLQKEKILPAGSQYSEQQLAQQQAVIDYSNEIVKVFNENSYTKDIITKNAITIGEGDDKFVFPINAKEVVDIVINGDMTGDLTFDTIKGADGQEQLVPKTEHQLLVATVNKYGTKFISELAKHYKSLGSKAAIDPIDNARPSQRAVPSHNDSEPTSVAGAMAKYGRVNFGG
jgi:hypothetical protein